MKLLIARDPGRPCPGGALIMIISERKRNVYLNKHSSDARVLILSKFSLYYTTGQRSTLLFLALLLTSSILHTPRLFQ